MSLKTQVKIALFQCDHIAHTNVGNRMVLLRLEVGHIAVFLIKVVVLHERFVQAEQQWGQTYFITSKPDCGVIKHESKRNTIGLTLIYSLVFTMPVYNCGKGGSQPVSVQRFVLTVTMDELSLLPT